MGDYAPSHYIECDGQKLGKADWLLHHLGHPAIEITLAQIEAADFDSKEDGYICIVENGTFDAALHIITSHDLERVTWGIEHGDTRPMRFVKAALDEISNLSGYSDWLERNGLDF